MNLEKMTEVARLLLELRNKKAALSATFNAECAKLDKLSDELVAVALAENAPTSGVVNIKTNAGTLMFDTKTRANVVDWPAFYDFISKERRFDFLHKRVTDNAVAAYVEDNPENPTKDLPPGVTLFRQRVVTVRKPGDV